MGFDRSARRRPIQAFDSDRYLEGLSIFRWGGVGHSPTSVNFLTVDGYHLRSLDPACFVRENHRP